MTAQGFLETDVSGLGRQLRAGLRWWLDELAQMLPDGVREALAARPSLCAELSGEGDFRFSRKGRAVAAPPRSGKRTPVVLLLPAAQVLVRRTRAPMLAGADIRRLLLLDLDRQTPFRAEDVYAAVAWDRADQAGRRPASLAVVSREAADAALAQARAAGLEPLALGLAGAEGFETALDFLPQAAGPTAVGGRGRRWIWGAVALLALANLLAAVLKDEASVGALREQARAGRPALQAAMALRRQVMDEDARRQRILEAHGGRDPRLAIAAATRALPDGAWVQRLSWNGRALRLAGYRQEGVDVLAALRASPAFAQVRNSTADTPARLAAGDPFDVTADLSGAAQ